ncbi:MAG: putative baseplate assembly protein, partial [Burkholderiales bacterium]|nr:putative baseplate assembly protein [Burkholderiales bacterium]
TATQAVISIEQLDKLPPSGYECYEPLLSNPPQTLKPRAAHNAISLYTWGARECCLLAGATRATLLDTWLPPVDAQAVATRALNIQPGDVLIFEEVLGAKTGVAADADPLRRWAVRVTQATLAEDTLYPVTLGSGELAQRLPTPLVEIAWATADALPFALCLSALGAAPECAYLADITVARGNIVLVDHGRKVDEPLPPVPGVQSTPCCECEGEPGEVQVRSGRYRPVLAQAPLVYREPLPEPAAPASRSLRQEPRRAVPALTLTDDARASWSAKTDLLASGPDDRDLVVETDNRGAAHLRFGDGELGRRPEVGRQLTAHYRSGGGAAGNVGAESICVLVLNKIALDGVEIKVRNPLPAVGGIDAEPIEEARLFAPGAFRQQIERAITAADYAALAERNAALQRAAARLAWTGSWYEADVAIDPLGTERADAALLGAITGELYRYRRVGHDLRVQAARYVPLKLHLEVCALPGHDRGHVKAALLVRFGARRGPGSTRGYFHPDALSLGDSVPLSRIIAAAQAVPGVECATVTEFHRLFAAPNHEIENGVLPLAAFEIAQLDNDPNHPERGQLLIDVRGGR